MACCADQKRTRFSLAVLCLRNSEQTPVSPLGERANYFGFNGKNMGSNLYRITCTAPCPVCLKMTGEYVKIGRILSTGCPFYLVSQEVYHTFYRVSILTCLSVREVYRIFYRMSILSCPPFWEANGLSTRCPFYLVPKFGKYIAYEALNLH